MNIKTSTSQLAGHNGSLSLRQILRCWDVAPRDLSLLCWRRWQLFILHFCLGHVVIPRVKILLLHKQNDRGCCKTIATKLAVSWTWLGLFQTPTPFCSLFLRKSEPPGLAPILGYLAFNLASSAFSGLITLSSISC